VGQKWPKYVNVNYIYRHPDHETARRCDVQNVETKQKLALKPPEERRREEEFSNDASFREVRRIMLSRKFETILAARSQAPGKEQKRLQMQLEKEEKRKQQVRSDQQLPQKGVCETYEEKNLIRTIKGPFY